MQYNRYAPSSFWDSVRDRPSVWAPILIGIALLLLFASVPAAMMVLDTGPLTPICTVYFILAALYIIGAGFLVFGGGEATEYKIGIEGGMCVIIVVLVLPVIASVVCMGCLMLGASLTARILPGTATGMDLIGPRDFLLYPGWAFRNAGFVMIPFLIYSLLALMRAKIQWESFKSTRVPSTSRL